MRFARAAAARRAPIVDRGSGRLFVGHFARLVSVSGDAAPLVKAEIVRRASACDRRMLLDTNLLARLFLAYTRRRRAITCERRPEGWQGNCNCESSRPCSTNIMSANHDRQGRATIAARKPRARGRPPRATYMLWRFVCKHAWVCGGAARCSNATLTSGDTLIRSIVTLK